MTDRDPTPDGFILEIHLVGGKVVHAPHTLVEAREAFAIIASEAPWLKGIADERAALAIGLGTGYRRLLATRGGIVIGDDQHGYWNVSEGSILALQVVDLAALPDAPQPLQIGFRQGQSGGS